jgi:tetratricopeptide (TPR) repeat protein
MKVITRLSLIVLLAFSSTVLFAQSLDKAKELFKAGKLPEAKAEIDKVLDVPKNQKNGEAWYNKMKICNAIAANDQLKDQFPDARQQAFDALKKYVDVDDKKLLFLQIDQYKPVNEIYQGFFQVGANEYNAAKYQDALENFVGALSTSTYMNSKGWTTLRIDTTSTLYAGIAAEKAGKKDTAAIYYGRLADSGIVFINGSNMVEIYKWLVDHYNQKKDEAMTNRYLAMGKKNFPDDLFWYTLELDNLRDKGDKVALFTKYDEVTAHFTKNHLFFFNYGLELYQYASDTSSGHRPANYDTLIAKAQENLKKCLEIQPDYPQAALVLGQISYNAGVDLQGMTKTVKGAKPEDIKKRADFRIAAGKKFDEAIPYFEKVDEDLGAKGKLKMDEKNTLKDAYDLLINIYEQKKIQDKIDSYTTKFNNVDKNH